MSASPRTEGCVPLPEQQHRLMRWLREWAVLQALEASDDAPDAPSFAAAWAQAPQSTAAAPTPCPGEIRLLQPHGDAAPVFVAVATPNPDQRPGTCLCVPFSRLGEPAMPGELTSGRAEAPVRVLCLWNTRTVAGAQLAGSWVTDHLAAEELERLNDAVQSWRTIGQVPITLRHAVGPPLRHPEDPRRAYLYLEQRRITDALGAAPHANVIDYPSDHERHELPKAAEDHARYDAHNQE